MPYPYHESRQILPNAGYERPGITPFAPRLSVRGYPETNGDPRYMPPADNVFMARQPLPQMPPLRNHQLGSYQPGTFDARAYYTPYEEAASPALGYTRDYDSQRSRAYDVESQ